MTWLGLALAIAFGRALTPLAHGVILVWLIVIGIFIAFGMWGVLVGSIR